MIHGDIIVVCRRNSSHSALSFIPADYSFYIGLNDEPTYARGDFRWTDGTPVTDNNWDDGQPDNNNNDNCVVIATWRNYKWVDRYCLEMFPYICEIDL